MNKQIIISSIAIALTHLTIYTSAIQLIELPYRPNATPCVKDNTSRQNNAPLYKQTNIPISTNTLQTINIRIKQGIFHNIYDVALHYIKRNNKPVVRWCINQIPYPFRKTTGIITAVHTDKTNMVKIIFKHYKKNDASPSVMQSVVNDIIITAAANGHSHLIETALTSYLKPYQNFIDFNMAIYTANKNYYFDIANYLFDAIPCYHRQYLHKKKFV